MNLLAGMAEHVRAWLRKIVAVEYRIVCWWQDMIPHFRVVPDGCVPRRRMAGRSPRDPQYWVLVRSCGLGFL